MLRRSVLGLLVLAVLASACTNGSSGSDRPTLTIYSGRTSDLIGPLLDEFIETADIDLEVRYLDSAELALLIDQEGANSPADVFISQNPGALAFLDSADRLLPLEPATLDLVDPANRASDGSWIGFSGRQRVLVYNTDLVDEAGLPDSVFDLTDPSYEGLVAVAPSNGSFQDFVTAMRADIGDTETQAWLTGLADNDTESYGNNLAIVEAVGRGEVSMGLVNHYYNYRVLAENPESSTANHYFAADDLGSTVIVTGAAALATTDRPDLANQFIAFLLSESAQTFFSEETFEYPLAAGVEPGPDLPPLAGTHNTESVIGSAEIDLAGTIELISDSGLSG